MTPRTLLRTAALNALAGAASQTPPDPDFAPLSGLQVFLGQTWPSQSPAPGLGPIPPQVLVYIWDENAESVSENTTAPQFRTTAMLVLEARVETRVPAATAMLPSTPSGAAIANAVDGALELLTFAIKKALCQGIGIAAQALNAGKPVIDAIRKVQIADKLTETGQRIAGNGVVTFDLEFGEWFEPVLANALSELNITIGASGTVAATPGNTGNGTIASLEVQIGAEVGIYWILLLSATAFEQTAPDGTVTTGTVGTAFNGGSLAYTVTAGSIGYAAGDGFTITTDVWAQTQLNLSS